MGIVRLIGGKRYEVWKSWIRDILPLSTNTVTRLKTPFMRFRQRYIEDFIFIHINKNGGTSIERALGIPFLNHDTLRERRKVIGDRRYRDRFKFSFVRNPFDRVFSLYKYRHQSTRLSDAERERERFNSWLWSELIETPRLGKMEMPQVEWLKNDDGEIEMDFIGRFERIGEDFLKVASCLNSRRVRLERMKETKNQSDPAGGGYRWWYGVEEKNKIKALYREDLEEFGYEF